MSESKDKDQEDYIAFQYRTLEDRISALPFSLILHILSFLSMKDVVKTSALSKQWRYLWTSVSTLSFNGGHAMEVGTRKFITFVYKALILCKSPKIEKFVLILKYSPCFAFDLNIFISFAIQNNVEDLELRLDFRRREIECYRLPQYIYCSSSLKKLKLNCCDVMPTSGVISWKSLKSLSMEGVELGDGVISQILLGSPCLEFLKLDYFRFRSALDIASSSLKKLVFNTHMSPREYETLLDISAPNLQSLEILGHFHQIKFRLRNVSSLINANLNFSVYYDGSQIGNYYQSQNLLRELFESLRHVKEVKIGSCCLQVMSILEVKGVPFQLSSCKSLALNAYVNRWDSPAIASLLRSSPNLETLVINMTPPCGEGFICAKVVSFYCLGGEDYWTSPKRILKCLLPHLKTVKIVGFAGDQSGFRLPFIQLLLKNATTLKRMDISVGKGYSYFRKCDISEFPREMQKLLSFPRSSPDAVIMFS